MSHESPQPQPQPQATQTQRSTVAGFIAWSTCIAAILMVLGVAFGHALARPPVIEHYEDFDVEIPTITVLVLTLSSTASAAFGSLIALLLLAKEVWIKNRAVTSTINLIVMFLAVVTGTVLAVALVLPSIKIMQSVM